MGINSIWKKRKNWRNDDWMRIGEFFD